MTSTEAPPPVLEVTPEAAQQIAAEAQSAKGKAPNGKVAVRPHRTVAERELLGREARIRRPRAGLNVWAPAPDRPDPVALLASQETSRVKELLPVRHARMAVSPFTFYRGSAIVMASDQGSMPNSGLTVQLCGDAHLSNFGAFAAPDRSLVFDINDFDETHPGPFEWDVQRLATSFVLAARENKVPDAGGVAAARAAAQSYRETVAAMALRPELENWYTRIDIDALMAMIERDVLVTKQDRKRLERNVAKARARDNWSAVRSLTTEGPNGRVFRDQPPLLVHLGLEGALADIVREAFRQYVSTLQEDRQLLLSRYEIIDFGHKVVGVGSVGLLAFVVLLRGRDDDDLLVLQVKQAQKSVLEPYTAKSKYSKNGRRVVAGQRLIQAASDSFLGWIDTTLGRSYYVRQLRDMKWAPDPAVLDANRLLGYAKLCGAALGRAHARAGDAIAIASYLGTSDKFDKGIAQFALAYSDQVALDYDRYQQAISSGAVDAREEASGEQITRGVEAVQEMATQVAPAAAIVPAGADPAGFGPAEAKVASKVRAGAAGTAPSKAASSSKAAPAKAAGSKAASGGDGATATKRASGKAGKAAGPAAG